MRYFLFLLMCGFGVSLLRADDFEVGKVIHPVVAEIPLPKIIEGFDQGQMAITTSSKEAARHFAQGLTMLNTSWDFEAYRHFCATVKLDPECLMGYWGISVCLAQGKHEFFDERQAAIERMLDLLEAEKEGEKDRWNEMETGFVQAAGYLFTDGGRTAGRAFMALAKKYPANTQARLLSLFLQRDGFNRSGDARYGQKKALAGVQKLMEEYPDSLSVKAFWISLSAEAPGNVPVIREKTLPVVKKLVEQFPEYPPFQLSLAHILARCGEAGEALPAAAKARDLYAKYMEDEKVAVYDCDGWVRAELYLATLHDMRGDTESAMKVAGKLAAIKIKEERVYSKGATMLMWDGRTLGARLLAGAKTKESFVRGKDMLGVLEEEEWFKEKSFAIYYRDCLAIYLGVREAIIEGKIDIAKKFYDQLMLRAQGLEKSRAIASQTSSYGNWLRAINTLRMLVPELRGLLSEEGEGATKLSAATWYSSAQGQQEKPSTLLPPSISYPMDLRLGDHYLGLEKYTEAASWYLKGLALRPNHLDLMGGLLKATEKLGKKEEAATLKKQIEAVRK